MFPGFSDPAHENYALDPTSALVDAGFIIPRINDHYSGRAPDIGAFEFETGNSPPVAVNDAASTWAGKPGTDYPGKWSLD